MKFNKLYSSIDTHTAGEPLRIITSGIPIIKGSSMLEKRQYFTGHFDYIRKTLMFEPRGHEGMYGCIVTEPTSLDADFGVLFMHNEGLSTMCGHGIIAVVTALIETGVLSQEVVNRPIKIDSPAGRILAFADCQDVQVKAVSFLNVPSFVYKDDITVNVLDKEIKVDIAFGGAFYVIVKASEIGTTVDINQLSFLKKIATTLKNQIEKEYNVQHPLEKDLKGIYGVIFSDEATKNDSHLRNVTVFADEQIDRSPCGTGTAARLASLFHHGEMQMNETFVHESIIGSQFQAEIIETTMVDNYKAVVPKITGSSYLTGIHQFVVDPTDPLNQGFLLK